ncbi:MAG: response regulator transcription factor [Chloroflexaceae bacterium]|jgi:DNA-binding response OmpR family regulator|nr:response regulator transcription factor [Chloroflexaceae bacterium]
MMQRILVVDDEPAIGDVLRERLEREGFGVRVVERGEAALDELAQAHYDLVLLDVGLPGIDGFEVLRQLRARNYELPVIVLSARGDEIDRVVGLELGADDYVVKPFSVRELAARVRVLLRRTAEVAQLRARLASTVAPPAPTALQLDTVRRRATFHEQPLELRPREFDLLALLAAHPGQVFSREALLRQVWGYDEYVDVRTVDVHVRRLRAKLAAIAPESQVILTEWGVGYRLAEE